MKKHITILGSTGSIGTQALEVVEAHQGVFEIDALIAQNNYTLLIEQAKRFLPNCVVIGNQAYDEKVRGALAHLPVKVFSGEDSILQVMAWESTEIVLTAFVGFAGLKPTLAAIEAGKHIALANKETLVVAGEYVTQRAREKGVNLYPVDSEHSAIFQCLAGEWQNPIECIYLTASGGPFRGKSREDLAQVTKAQALKHPNWSMGAKITIDSATLMNKGLEAIEAKWLFNLRPDQIRVIVHPQSIVHSIVQFTDGSMKAQMGLPDMKLPIQYALTYPARLPSLYPRFDFTSYPALTFEKPDIVTFRNLALAYEALEKGGTLPCAMNAANEVAVAAFLQNQIAFLQMADLIELCMKTHENILRPSINDYFKADAWARNFCEQWLEAKAVQ